MKPEDSTNELTASNLMIRFTAVCRRLISTTEALNDATSPWLKGGRAKVIIESSASNAEAIGEISARLCENLCIVQMLLDVKSESPQGHSALSQEAKQRCGASARPKLDDLSGEMLSLVCAGARETAELIRSFWNSPAKWCASKALENREEVLDFVLRSLDYYRWQILKEFAKLVTIFDDHDDPGSDEPCDAWEQDARAIDSD